jgi:adenylate cyclase
MRLRPSILTMFVVLTVPVFSIIVATNYVTNQSIAEENATHLVERFRADATDSIRQAIEPINSLVRSAAVLGREQPKFYSDKASLPYLLSMLHHSKTIIATYVGLADGSFRQARQLSPGAEIHGSLPPEGARYAYRWIDPPSGSTPALDRYVFLDPTGKKLGTAGQSTRYDPRQRFWYKEAAEKGALVISDPEVFAVFDLIGFTVAAPFYSGDKIAGVAAADITLDGLSEYLSAHKISPGALSYILDRTGGVIANSERARTYGNESGRVELQHITSLPNSLPAIAFGSRPRQNEELFSFSHDGEAYIASLTRLPPEFGKRWQLFIITPMHDFTGAFDKTNKRLLAFGVVAIALQILIIYFLSAVISLPLEKLALKVARIQSFRPDEMPAVVSRVQEVAVLSNAIGTLGATVKSFAAFVPVDLVKQLLNSDRTLTLGGHSRFLTIFFSDLEAFSTLSEELPSQELMLRLSFYLQLVTDVVNDEAGTIDKFIGDGVMAFWGAPALLDDHAWHACVAALRIDRGMKALNARWAAEELKPLQLRIGIHSDAVIVGNIGSPERMGYTVIGDGVNIAARLEGINKEYGTRLCISHSVFREAGERLCVRPIDEVTVKGRRTRIRIYELLGAFDAGPELEPDLQAVRLSKLSRIAYEALIHEDFALALQRYNEILTEFPDDSVTREIVRRLEAIGSVPRIQQQVSR